MCKIRFTDILRRWNQTLARCCGLGVAQGPSWQSHFLFWVGSVVLTLRSQSKTVWYGRLADGWRASRCVGICDDTIAMCYCDHPSTAASRRPRARPQGRPRSVVGKQRICSIRPALFDVLSCYLHEVPALGSWTKFTFAFVVLMLYYKSFCVLLYIRSVRGVCLETSANPKQ